MKGLERHMALLGAFQNDINPLKMVPGTLRGHLHIIFWLKEKENTAPYRQNPAHRGFYTECPTHPNGKAFAASSRAETAKGP